ncbi:MAG TPA: sulfite exporter TauE/SafE family protein, partial [Taishania sp.]|nr:sulfite exporter TauE/SafE family protein [Taishania sp.]
MFIIGLIIAVFVGITMGLIGGGGSVITVPMLVYLFGFNAIAAVTYSFFIVGTTSLVGSYAYYKKDLLDFKTAFVFGIPSILAIFITRFLILPAIPATINISDGLQLSKEYALLLLFAIVMVWAAWNMLKKKKNDALVETSVVTIFTQGAFVGFLTGLTGAGGGFLIIP